MLPEAVQVIEVGPRDGLQSEPDPIRTQDKIWLVDALAQRGRMQDIEVTAFVSPKAIPQLADASEVMAGIQRVQGARYSALVPNMKGLEAAMEAKVSSVAVFTAASETFTRKNIRCSIAESLKRYEQVARAARDSGVPVRGYVSCVVGCPYEGPIAPTQVASVSAALIDLGCYQISLGDTIGCGTPLTIRAMVQEVKRLVPAELLAAHFHDTAGQALDNVFVAMEEGLTTVDSAVGGLGGCPYAPGAPGNLSTEKLLDALDRAQIEANSGLLDRSELRKIGEHVQQFIISKRRGSMGLI